MAKPNMGSEGVDREIVGDGGATGDAWSSGLLGVPFRTLLLREVNRFLKVWTQTLFAPLLTSALYVVVFGYGLGSRLREVQGVPYLQFILPGLILLAVITASYGNTSSSIFDAKRERYIDDVLISPMTPSQMALAYVLGGALRGLVVGAGTYALAVPLVGLPA
ncbi:MAG: ABC transporter permease [Actinomycetota bacterium]|nr:ABC transporter permease [Actinomycetota bacterium]